MPELSPSAAAELAALSEQELAIELAKHRSPDLPEQYREIAKTIVPEGALDAVVSTANYAAFVDKHGNIDEPRVRANLNAMKSAFGWETVNSGLGGAAGRAEAERRYGSKGSGSSPTPHTPPNAKTDRVEGLKRRGSGGQAAGLAEAQRRFGNNGGEQ